MIHRLHALTVLVGLTAIPCGWMAAADPPSTPLKPDVAAIAGETFPGVKLRGYGTVAGRSWTLNAPSGKASLLQIACDSEAAAQLLCAKYLSDLSVLPGVSAALLPTSIGKVATSEIAGQGGIAAGRVGRNVDILAAGSATNLAWTIDQTTGLAKAAWTPEIRVPMYLDRWDRVGMRFYYWFWRTPSGTKAQDYAFTGDFDYAKQQDTGYVFWDGLSGMNSDVGLANEGVWDWGPLAAQARQLPFGLNLSTNVGHEDRWLLNRFVDQIQPRMPQFSGSQHGIANPYMEGKGVLSWCAKDAYDASLGIMQASLRRFAAMPNLVSILEPHGELCHGDQDILLEYGPLADASYSEFLKAAYGSVDVVSQRWYGKAKRIAAWTDIRVPELAAFLGWNADAIDLAGSWSVRHEDFPEGTDPPKRDPWNIGDYPPYKTEPAPNDWFQPEFDAAAWPQVMAPGSDIAMFIPHRPAVYRRGFTVDAKYLAAHPRSWLYVWDCNQSCGDDKLRAYLNGRQIGESAIIRHSPHWAAFPVHDALRAGGNLLALRVPDGFLGYRVYLSGEEPRQYPQLGEGRNAQWADLIGWTQSTRVQQVERGLGMIRQVDPDRQITLMAPDHWNDAIKNLAEDYGCEFKDTGFMAIGYYDFKPGMMQASGLPFSVELGGPARNLDEFRYALGSYLISNVQCVDYYIHEGDIMWNEEIRQDFEANSRLYHLFGKFHAPKGDLAVLYTTQAGLLTGFPWGNDPNAGQRSGYFNWNIATFLRGEYAYDDLSESSFVRGAARNYPVIVDSNSVIMDERLVAGIEQWVRDGGTFITSGQTGRHTPTRFNDWPISRLSGYAVTRIDQHTADGNALERHRLATVPGQGGLPAAWAGQEANGLGLKRQSPECSDLLLWDDGTVAVGARKLGKGQVIQVGVKFGNSSLPDRIELTGSSHGDPATRKLHDLYAQLLDRLAVPRTPVACTANLVFPRHYVSNNGLYDIWVIWNADRATINTDLVLGAGYKPATCSDVSTGERVALSAGDQGTEIRDIQLEPFQARAFLTPRSAIGLAARDWFALQRDWWRGTKVPFADKLPTPTALQTCTIDLTLDWAFKPLAEGDNAQAMAAPGVNDAAWPRMRLGIWNIPDHPQVHHAILRKAFRVPDAWTNGKATLWLQNHDWWTFHDRGNVWLDGGQIASNNTDGIHGRDLPGLKAGSEHVLAIEVEGQGDLNGVTGNSWVSWAPAPAAQVDLAGDWMTSIDALRFDAPLSVPGKGDGLLAKRTIDLGTEHAGKTVIFHCVGNPELLGIIINGRWLRQDHHPMSREWYINITPWVRFGGRNEIQIGQLLAGDMQVEAVSLDIYKPGDEHP